MASQRRVEELVGGTTGDEPDESCLPAEDLSDHHPGQGPNDGRGQDPGDSIGSLRPRRSRSGRCGHNRFSALTVDGHRAEITPSTGAA